MSPSPFKLAPPVEVSSPFTEPPPGRQPLALRALGSLLVTLSVCALSYSLWETKISSWMAARAQQQLEQQFNDLMAAGPLGEIVEESSPASTKTEWVRVGGASTPLPGRDTADRDDPAESSAVGGEPGVSEVAALEEAAPPVRDIPKLPAEGELVGRVVIEAIGVDWFVQSGTSSSVLRSGPGLWEYGSFPGAPGNATLSAHRTTYGGPFRHLDRLELGDRIVFQTPGRPDAVFEVRGWDRVTPRDVQVTGHVDGVRLTLLTCDPPGSTAKRLVVQAELVEGEFADIAVPAEEWTFLR